MACWLYEDPVLPFRIYLPSLPSLILPTLQIQWAFLSTCFRLSFELLLVVGLKFSLFTQKSFKSDLYFFSDWIAVLGFKPSQILRTLLTSTIVLLTTNPDYIGIKNKADFYWAIWKSQMKYISMDYTSIIGKYANIPFL